MPRGTIRKFLPSHAPRKTAEADEEVTGGVKLSLRLGDAAVVSSKRATRELVDEVVENHVSEHAVSNVRVPVRRRD